MERESQDLIFFEGQVEARKKVEADTEKYRKFYYLVASASGHVIDRLLDGQSIEDEELDNILNKESKSLANEEREDEAINKVARRKINEGINKYLNIRESVNTYKEAHKEGIGFDEIKKHVLLRKEFVIDPNLIDVRYIEGGIELNFKSIKMLGEFLGTKTLMGDAKDRDADLHGMMLPYAGSFGYLLDKKEFDDEFNKEFLGNIIVTFGANSNEIIMHEQKEAIGGLFIEEAKDFEKNPNREKQKENILDAERELISDLAAKIEDGWDLRFLPVEALGIDNICEKYKIEKSIVGEKLLQIIKSALVFINYSENNLDSNTNTKCANLLRSTIVNPDDFIAIVKNIVGDEKYEKSWVKTSKSRNAQSHGNFSFIHELSGREMHSEGTLGPGSIVIHPKRKTKYQIMRPVSAGSYGVVYQAQKINPVTNQLDGLVYIKETVNVASDHAVRLTNEKYKTYSGKDMYETIEIDFPRRFHSELYQEIDTLPRVYPDPNNPDNYVAYIQELRKLIENYLNREILDDSGSRRITRRQYYKEEAEQRRNSTLEESKNAHIINTSSPNSVIGVKDTIIDNSDSEKGDKLLLILEEAPGVVLDEFIDELRLINYQLKEQDMAAILIAYLSKLYGMHKLNMVHCDLKPANLFIKIKRTPDGKIANQNGSALNSQNPQEYLTIESVGVIDLGNIIDEEMKKTGADKGVGTWGYAAPEIYPQASGGVPATDIYALGVMVTHMLRGENAPMSQHLNLTDSKEAENLIKTVNSSVSDNFYRILTKMLEANSKHRYQSAQELLNDLEIYNYPHDTQFPFNPGFHFTELMNCQTFEQTKQYILKFTANRNGTNMAFPGDFRGFNAHFPTYLGIDSRTGQSDQNLSDSVELIRDNLNKGIPVSAEIAKRGGHSMLTTADGRDIGYPRDDVATVRIQAVFTRHKSEEDRYKRIFSEMSFVTHIFDVAKKLVNDGNVPDNIRDCRCPIVATMLNLLDIKRF